MTIDLDTRNTRTVLLDENVTTVSMSNIKQNSVHNLIFVQDATGGRTVSGWPASITWLSGGGSAPDFSGKAANSASQVCLTIAESTSTIYGTYVV